jgi:hypothetical protein
LRFGHAHVNKFELCTLALDMRLGKNNTQVFTSIPNCLLAATAAFALHAALVPLLPTMEPQQPNTLHVWLATFPERTGGDERSEVDHRSNLNLAVPEQVRDLVREHGLIAPPETGGEVICALVPLTVGGLYNRVLHTLTQAQRHQYNFWRMLCNCTHLFYVVSCSRCAAGRLEPLAPV